MTSIFDSVTRPSFDMDPAGTAKRGVTALEKRVAELERIIRILCAEQGIKYPAAQPVDYDRTVYQATVTDTFS